MFGYIRPYKAELLVREFEEYRGVYCGLCRQLGKQYGFAARMTLSYDCTFYALVFLGRSALCGGFHQGRCTVNPLKKCTFCADEQEPVRLAAAISVLLAYQKVRDDFRDGGIGKKISRVFVWPFLAHAAKKAAREYPECMEAAASMMEDQEKAEQDPQAGLDRCAEPTAVLLRELFLAGLKRLETDHPGGESAFRVLDQFGYHLGRWIYLMDACDDLEKDLKRKRFNPLIRRFKLGKDASEEQKKEALLYANGILNLSMAQISGAFELLEIQNTVFGPILRNIVQQGLPQMQKEILFQKKERENVGSV